MRSFLAIAIDGAVRYILMSSAIWLSKTTEITCDGFQLISNMSDISLVIGTFSYKKQSHCTVGIHLFSVDFDDFSTIYLIF